jgi:pyruvate-ferredoxin/flavodoxin oxidoreductase
MLSLLKKLLGSSDEPKVEPVAEVDAAVDGARAVAIAEACIVEAAALSRSLSHSAIAPMFKNEITERDGANLLGRAVSGFEASDPRSALATALGLSMSGLRATAFFSAPELAAASDQLALAAGRHLPVVFHLACQANDGTVGQLGSGHDVYHNTADSGCFSLFASNVQEAVDFSLVARRAAEQALIPAIVAMDGAQTAASIQNVRLPSLELVKRYLGGSEDTIDAPTGAQELIFGSTRRRVPRWYDLEEPMLYGAVHDARSWGVNVAGQGAFFYDHLPQILSEQFALFGEQTGRHYSPLSEYRLQDARSIIVAQGAAVEMAQTVADHLRSEYKEKVGVVGVRWLRPIPEGRLADILRGKEKVLVLERGDAPLSTDLPLLQELRALSLRALETGRDKAGPGAARGWGNKDLPRFFSASYGLGDYPLRAADLVALWQDLANHAQRTYLGLNFLPTSSSYPKRAVLLDKLRRNYPAIESSGVSGTADGALLDLRPEGAFSVSVFRQAGHGGEGHLPALANILAPLVGGGLRSRIAVGWEAWNTLYTDHLLCGDASLRDLGDQVPADVSLVAVPALDQLEGSTLAITEGGAVILDGGQGDDASLFNGLPAAWRTALNDGKAKLFLSHALIEETDAERHHRLLGALVSALREEGKIDAQVRRLLSLHADVVEGNASTERLQAAFREGLLGLKSISSPEGGLGKSDVRDTSESQAPFVVRWLSEARGEDDGSLGSLPRFWSQTGVLYQAGATDNLSPDPYLTAGALPPLSSTFRTTVDSRLMFPQFDANACTGCGRCWTNCPDGAIGPVALGAKQLVESGMEMVAAKGGDAGALRAIMGKLATQINKQFKTIEPQPQNVQDVLAPAFATVVNASNVAPDRRAALEKAFAAVVDCLAPLPLVRSEVFFEALEKQRANSGEFLSLAFDPDACKGCAGCVEACDDGALESLPQNQERIDDARTIWEIWAQLPTTPSVTVDRVREDDSLSALAALLLSRDCRLSVGGGDGVEAGSGAKVALRLALAAGEDTLRERLIDQVRRVGSLRSELTALVRKLLADSLPVEDMDALADAVAATGQGRVPLAEFAESVKQAGGATHVDVVQLQRAIQLAKELEQAHQSLTRGRHGLGRSRLGLVLAPNALSRGLAAFPYNPFQIPVVVDGSGEAAALAHGLLEGQLREAAEGYQLIRRAELELNNPTEALLKEAELKKLSWHDLSPEERRMSAPLLLVGNSEAFSDRSLAELLDSDHPLKILLLADAGTDLATTIGGDLAAARSGMGLLGLGHRGAYIAQSSIAYPEHFAEVLAAAFDYQGPAVIHVHAPSPQQHGFHTRYTVEQARQAVLTRAFPLFSYDPKRTGLFGQRISLAANPSTDQDWYRAADEQIQTPAHWALSEKRFAAHFSPVAEGDSVVPLADYLGLDTNARATKSPVIRHGEGTFVVSTQLAAIVEHRAKSWSMLQELAGVKTPFVDVIVPVSEEVEGAHREALQEQAREFEGRIAALQQTYDIEATKRVRDGLLALAGYDVGPAPTENA